MFNKYILDNKYQSKCKHLNQHIYAQYIYIEIYI